MSTESDGTYGYTLEQLMAVDVPPVPDGFEAFWRNAYARARQISPNVTRRRTDGGNESYDVWEVEFDSLDGVRIGAWLVTRRDVWPQTATRGVVVGHGYGGRQAPEVRVPGTADVAIYPCARGFDRSAHPKIPNQAFDHVIHGIDAPETYSHLGSCADLVWCAANALQSLFPRMQRFWYRGGSFGGGIGALGLPWDERYDRAFLAVPSFGNHPLRLQMPCVGSGESVRKLHAQRPEIFETLKFFDAAVAGRFMTIPVLVAAAVQDPAVPPPGQFSVYNGIASAKKLLVRQAGHMDHPANAEDDCRINAEVEAWFVEE